MAYNAPDFAGSQSSFITFDHRSVHLYLQDLKFESIHGRDAKATDLHPKLRKKWSLHQLPNRALRKFLKRRETTSTLSSPGSLSRSSSKSGSDAPLTPLTNRSFFSQTTSARHSYRASLDQGLPQINTESFSEDAAQSLLQACTEISNENYTVEAKQSNAVTSFDLSVIDLFRLRRLLVTKMCHTYHHARTMAASGPSATSGKRSFVETDTGLRGLSNANGSTAPWKARCSSNDGDSDSQKSTTKRQSKRPKMDHSSLRLLACPFTKVDPIRYSDANVREKQYRGCKTCFLSDIPRVK